MRKMKEKTQRQEILGSMSMTSRLREVDKGIGEWDVRPNRARTGMRQTLAIAVLGTVLFSLRICSKQRSHPFWVLCSSLPLHAFLCPKRGALAALLRSFCSIFTSPCFSSHFEGISLCAFLKHVPSALPYFLWLWGRKGAMRVPAQHLGGSDALLSLPP